MLTNNCVIGKLRKQSGRSQSLPEAEASHTACGQSLLRKGQFRYAGKQRPLRKSIAERFAALTREERTLGSQSLPKAEASSASRARS
ncbi:hypothetical protein Y697_13995 [Mesotoga sp. BH458_6_3_2_1]|nr:hypothetical protein Y697_13995 [Mesotoga sp. BH458_6_3_2_1]